MEADRVVFQLSGFRRHLTTLSEDPACACVWGVLLLKSPGNLFVITIQIRPAWSVHADEDGRIGTPMVIVVTSFVSDSYPDRVRRHSASRSASVQVQRRRCR
jgi:hypothetical protein